jgi:hypothetical protein
MHAKLHLIRMVDTLMTAHTLPAQRCFSRATPENTVMLNLCTYKLWYPSTAL